MQALNPVSLTLSSTSQNSQVAFVFASEVEANDFYKKVSKRGKYLKGEYE